ncbi:regulatory protein, MarR [Nocardioides sp. JS614]|nr:regulatory protein, MarR [Nocardioides sp. JS614]
MSSERRSSPISRSPDAPASTSPKEGARPRRTVESLARQIDLVRTEYGHDFDVLPLKTLLLLHRIIATVSRAEGIELGPSKLNGTYFNILTVLHRCPGPISMKELAEALSVQPPNLTGAVRDLIDRGLLARNENPEDRRSYTVGIAPRGENLLSALLPGHWSMLSVIFSSLSHDELDVLSGLLERVLADIADPLGPKGLKPTLHDAANHTASDTT